MSHLNKIHAVCKFSYFRPRYLKSYRMKSTSPLVALKRQKADGKIYVCKIPKVFVDNLNHG